MDTDFFRQKSEGSLSGEARYSSILIDAYNLYYRAYSVATGSNTVDGSPVSRGIYTALRMVQRLESIYLKDGGRVYLLFDNCTSSDSRRVEIDPEYKASRTRADEQLYRSLDMFQMVALSYKDNWAVVYRQGYEADDLVFPLLSIVEGRILMVSNDLDWSRAITTESDLARHESGEYVVYNRSSFRERYGYYPSLNAVCIYKSLRGDSSDNIPSGVPGIRTEDIVYLIDRYSESDGSPERVIAHMIEDIGSTRLSDTWKKKIYEQRARIMLNCRLVNFLPLGRESVQESIFRSRYQPKVLYDLYTSLGFDIDRIDRRVAQLYQKVETVEDSSSFFRKQQIPRA